MRLWAEEKRSGSIELLLTLPLPVWATVLGKFLAAWVFAGLALALTFPIWITVNYLGHPDNGVILASYVGSFLMAGGYLSIGAAISAATSNQVIAFVVSVVVCFLFTVAGAPVVIDAFQGWAPVALVDAVFADPLARPGVVGPDEILTHYADRAGHGGLVEVSMLEAMAHFAVEPFASFFALGQTPTSADRPRLAQAYILRTADERLIAIHLSSLEKFWQDRKVLAVWQEDP